MAKNKVSSQTVSQDAKSDEDFETAQNNHLNEAFDAAVMQYVNGSLNPTESPKKKRKQEDEDEDVVEDYEFAQWTGFLDSKFMNDDQTVTTAPVKKKSKKDKKSKRKSKSKVEDDDLAKDPEFDEIDAEQTRIVETAIQNAHAMSHELDEAQEQRILAAANEVVASETLTTTDIPDTTSIVIEAKDDDVNSSPIERYPKRSQTKQHSVVKEPHKLPEIDFSRLSDIDTLVKEVGTKSFTWYNENVAPEERNKPRPFSREEEDSEKRRDHFWKRAFRSMPYRSQSSFYKHCRRKFHVFDVRAKWSPEDDDRLRQLAIDHAGKWKQVGDLMGRMPEDCRDRWRNYVKCGNKRSTDKWTQEELDKLLTIVQDEMSRLTNGQIGGTENQLKNINWTVVSEKMNGVRSRIQCRYKWVRISNDLVKNRVSSMSDDIKSWLVHKIKEIGYHSIKGVDWDNVSSHYFKDHTEEQISQEPYKWGSFDFKEAFSQLCAPYKDLKFDDLMTQLTGVNDSLKPDEYVLLRN
ncbi:REB1 DNA-binding protein REB1 [Candida maltosa Xu316]